jgi:hypothetical protein
VPRMEAFLAQDAKDRVAFPDAVALLAASVK